MSASQLKDVAASVAIVIAGVIAAAWIVKKGVQNNIPLLKDAAI